MWSTRTCRWCPNSKSPSNRPPADVVTLQVDPLQQLTSEGTGGLPLAIVDTVTLNRRRRWLFRRHPRPAAPVQKPRGLNDENPPTAIPACADVISSMGSRFTPRRSYTLFRPYRTEGVWTSTKVRRTSTANGHTTSRRRRLHPWEAAASQIPRRAVRRRRGRQSHPHQRRCGATW